MKVNTGSSIFWSALLAGWLTAMGGCSTATIAPPPPPPPSPPSYVQVPHPLGTDLGDLRGIMQSPEAPSRESLKGCDADFKKLRLATQSEDERRQGARELVKTDPVRYHWCFYGKVLDLEDLLKTSTYVDERQKQTLETYQFLVPIARGFLAEYHDSRYLRWAIQHYRRISEWVFFRRVELSPEGTSELVQVANPFGLWRENAPQTTVLEKYGILKPAGEVSPGAEAKNIFPASESETAASTPTAPAPVAAPSPETARKPASTKKVVDPKALPAIEPPAAPY